MSSTPAQIDYHSMRPAEVAAVVDLVLRVFDEFVAPGYTQAGIDEFRKHVAAGAVAQRLADGHRFIVATADGRLVGVVEMRENRHIALLFVEKAVHDKGIARELVRRAIDGCRQRQPDVRRITVNSSPNAVAAYGRMGFRSTGGEQAVNGIRFVPMALDLEEQTDRPLKGNLFGTIPHDLPEEWVEVLASGKQVRIERIVSRGQASPAGFWYDQEQNEFVLLLEGRARLSMEGVDQEIRLLPGDWIDIPAHRRHRVNWTDPRRDTVWLAVFY